MSNFVIQVATVNGSGSQSSNNVLVRSLFRAGVAVGGKNLFPSNIQGLPTWFTIRVSEKGYTGRRLLPDICIALNPQTFASDLKNLLPGGFIFYNAEFKIAEEQKRSDVKMFAIPFRELVAPISDSVKLRKLLINMTYVGVLAELLHLSDEFVTAAIEHQFEGKSSAIALNLKCIQVGREYVKTSMQKIDFTFRIKPIPNGNADKILIDGNSASAIGLIFGGCNFVSWYPITPSSSLVETFESLASEHRLDANGKKTFAVIQAEDELAAISMVIGAGWMGARAMTATSGPGLSLMAEAAGLAYYAEIPAVIWDVQRVGPSTGLPTRTMQGDLAFAFTLSHGDAKHVILLPGHPNECFEFGQVALDLAERLQTLVIVLSDLDLGMNFHIAEKFNFPTRPLDRGKVLSVADLEKAKTFARYQDFDGDGIPQRTLPGTEHPLASYFTRGTGHDESSRYSEDSTVFKKNMDRLDKKWETAKSLVPKPLVDLQTNAKVGLIAFGSSHHVIEEIRNLIAWPSSYLRLRALPLSVETEEFLNQHDRVYVIEQNRDGQLLGILRVTFPEYAMKLKSIRIYDGLPLSAEEVARFIMSEENQ
jgi:2-oxoglutarate ferredoxin oxidoreductase subunit alpha